jgi:hypothetical protein
MEAEEMLVLIYALGVQYGQDLSKAEAEPNMHNDYAMGVLQGKVEAISILKARIEDITDRRAFKENMEEHIESDDDVLPPGDKWGTCDR